MSKPVISVENLSKAYRIGLKEEIPDTLVGAATSWLRKPLRNLRKLQRLNTFESNGHVEDDTIWALKDVSFEVQEGEVVGIIGRNGAGKSTLLKILSRITEPTSGRAIIRGRVSSLLEVGTGFHPELTGRENIYLNGTILGMKKREIDGKFDEIVEFSGVEKFLDTPIKRYSSGMKVRLAFAVAAHLEPEILIIDEVLAVGDAEFQKKCMGKMQDVAKGGRTVLFVSHNMAAIQGLCPRALLFDSGKLTIDRETQATIDKYLEGSVVHYSQYKEGSIDLSCRQNSYTPNQLYIKGLRVLRLEGTSTQSFASSKGIKVVIETEGLDMFRSIQIGIIIKSDTGQWLANFNTGMSPPKVEARTRHEIVTLCIDRLPFVPGNYWLDLSVGDKINGRIDYVERAYQLHVDSCDIYGTGYSPRPTDGIVYLEGMWSVEPYDKRILK